MDVVVTPRELLDLRAKWQGARVAFVPTMGALHMGHLALVQEARQIADRVVVSIFVNPTQFGPSEDFSKYPRTTDADCKLLSTVADAVFLPEVKDIYPDGFQTYVNNRVMSQILCGGRRVGHFDGVLTVVMKLLNLVRADVALFGKKDYQQWRLIEQMVRDFSLPFDIIGVPIVREIDGLAMSSRNRYLDPDARLKAPAIYRALTSVQTAFHGGCRDEDALLSCFRQELGRTPGIEVEYVSIVTQNGLRPPSANISEPVVVMTACHLEGVRLIDNLEL